MHKCEKGIIKICKENQQWCDSKKSREIPYKWILHCPNKKPDRYVDKQARTISREEELIHSLSAKSSSNMQ